MHKYDFRFWCRTENKFWYNFGMWESQKDPQIITVYNIVDKIEDQVIYKVDPFYINQYSGLNDKNNEKIYENDIVQINMTNVNRYLCSTNRSEVNVSNEINSVQGIIDLFDGIFTVCVFSNNGETWDCYRISSKLKNSYEIVSNVYKERIKNGGEINENT